MRYADCAAPRSNDVGSHENRGNGTSIAVMDQFKVGVRKMKGKEAVASHYVSSRIEKCNPLGTDMYSTRRLLAASGAVALMHSNAATESKDRRKRILVNILNAQCA